MTPPIKWLADITEKDIGIVGGKGLNLGIMYRRHLPVPPGFVVTAQTYAEFLERAGIKDKIYSLLRKVDVRDTEKLQKIAKEIQQLIIGAEIPPTISASIANAYEKLCEKVKNNFVAVRSSATAEDLPSASFAGQQETFLNVHEKENVLDAVRSCWASLFTARAIYYREKNKFPHNKVLIAVVVQHQIASDKSGVMFTINPATNNESEIMIEGAFGLGEAVVSGAVNPDLYILNKEDLKIKKIELKKQLFKLVRDRQTGKTIKQKLAPEEERQQVLATEELKKLAKLGKRLEEMYHKPQDVEWAIERGITYLVQTRAVTTFGKMAIEKPQAIGEQAPILVRGETASHGVAIGKVRIILRVPDDLKKVQQGDVLVTVMTNPDMVVSMQKAAAIVTEEGGVTSHAAIVSRELGIPCIIGTEKATKVLKDGQLVTVHATRGIVYAGAIKTGTWEKEGRKKEKPMEKGEKGRKEIASTKTKIKLILDLPQMAVKAAAAGAAGVGLVRLEFIIAQGGMHPAQYLREGKKRAYAALLVDGIKQIAEAFKGKPVWVRNSDMRSDEYRALKGGDKEPKESDPMIGWHGIRRLLDEPEILKAEFEAIKQLHRMGYTNVGVMLPFVIRAEEVQRAKRIMKGVGLVPCKDVAFGVMIETPAACWEIESICKEGVSFVSFGTNDLTQLTLGIDRNNSKISKLYDELHPAVLGEMEKVLSVCRKYGVETSICGQAGSRPEMARFLVKNGVGSISVNVDAVDVIRKVVAKAEKEAEK